MNRKVFKVPLSVIAKKGCCRIVVSEIILGCLGQSEMVKCYNYDSEKHKLRISAIAYDDLWRECQAALSVGMDEFTRFEVERVQHALRFEDLLQEFVNKACLKLDVYDILIEFQGMGWNGIDEICVNNLTVAFVPDGARR